MQTLKITAFLMCPTGASAALGGSPQAIAFTGGHIKKAAANDGDGKCPRCAGRGGFVGAHEAALQGLGHLFAQPQKIVCTAVQPLANARKLRRIGLGAIDFPARHGGFAKVRAVRPHPLTKLLLRELQGLAARSQPRSEG